MNGQFAAIGFERVGYSGTAKLNAVVGDTVAAAHLPRFTPHAIRKTLALFGDDICATLEERKAWSMNLGHEHLTTMANNYIPVSRERQGELIRKLSGHS
ncbi:MAG: hypothetical protein MK180_18680 [Rhodobacteraceae bacterium]|nr:hypothetical protein [Paracoccaceae bacterium]